MDNDSQMVESSGLSLINLVVKYKELPLQERMQMKPSLDEAIADHTRYKLKLLKEGVIVTAADLTEMAAIKKEIEDAAKAQSLFIALAKFIAFLALRV